MLSPTLEEEQKNQIVLKSEPHSFETIFDS